MQRKLWRETIDDGAKYTAIPTELLSLCPRIISFGWSFLLTLNDLPDSISGNTIAEIYSEYIILDFFVAAVAGL